MRVIATFSCLLTNFTKLVLTLQLHLLLHSRVFKHLKSNDVIRGMLHYYGAKVTLTSDVHDTDVFVLWNG